ncbi:MAG: methionyl-tRNA formyltransferase [Nitrospirae bacterium GWC2_42_7]|nr:MAG: methionyl-tRNA formyltransferase [Nitrospirae bacterium GWC2_42_7]
MRIIYFGTPDFAVPSLKALVEAGEDVVAVVSQPDKLKGRGHKLSQPPVKEFALSKGLHIIQPSGIRSDDFCKSLSELKPDVIVVVAYGRIIPPAILKLPPLGCINVHASLLPKYRGAAPIQWSIIKGEKTTGITTMLMDEGLDTGDMLLKEETEIKDDDNALTLSLKLSETGASLLMKTLSGLKDNSIRPVPQTGEPSYAPPLKKEDGRIDWSLPAIEIFNLIRGIYPWPGAYCYLGKERINIIKARAIDNIEKPVSARIEKIAGEEIYVGTGRGILSVLEVKPDGKKKMSATAFMNGRRLKEGASFDAI